MTIRLHLTRTALSLLLTVSTVSAYDIPGYTPDQVIEYKQTVNSSNNPVGLDLHIFTPDGHQATDSRPCIVFFFGGGWVNGSPSHFHPHCEYLASRGIVAVSAEYRTQNDHGTTPQECVKDGKSAVRYLRANAAALGIDPNRIAAGGGSAGGHIAAATGTLSSYEEPGENLSISSRPNALVLYNPVFDNGPGGYGHDRVQAYWQDISPLHNITATAPPTTVFLGTNDALVPVSAAKNYKTAMEAEGLRCDLHLYQDQPHSFFNFDVQGDSSGPFYGYDATVFLTDQFLVSIGYLTDPHAAPEPITNWETIFGNAGFSGDSEATASPLTTDASTDAIAANFTPINLVDGDYIRLTGTVTLNAAMTAGNFRIGLFNGDNPVTAGDGTGYSGIWASSPGSSAGTIARASGTSSSNPFESNHSTTLGPIASAGANVPANTPVDFTMLIARNGDKIDLLVRFSDGANFHHEQNLLNLALNDFSYNSVAFLMTGNLSSTQAQFSNIAVVKGHTLVAPAEPPVAELTDALIAIDFNRNDALSSPSQSKFRIVSGSTTQNDNATSYIKNYGAHQVTISQPNAEKFEFRGANTDSTRAIPGGDTSKSFLVSDFIATRKGAINIQITNLPAGDYTFRSYHLEPITSNVLGFAQGVNNTTPNTIEARIGGVVQESVQPTALGAAGLNTTFINNSQIPTITFELAHDGTGPLTIELRSTQSNGTDNFLLLNGFELFQAAP
ncbi:hypothetical protein NT6N_27810 [Oceaniferula spumae]|uniref:Alpha/beta hydrolase n=1 Tax=Oceaniferula spumae TaxID=2979115 RepID=A0AAT9FPA8_9BACT